MLYENIWHVFKNVHLLTFLLYINIIYFITYCNYLRKN